jgi:DeoR/GlpR family transcriptional regulator of sugar metabolism
VLAAERQATIALIVRERGTVSVTELVDELGVSGMTIRRDLEVLDRERILRKVHGGATAPWRTSTEEPGFERNVTQLRAEKTAIASAARSMIRPGYSIALSAGTTTWTLAQMLGDVDDLTVVTNSPRIAEVLDESNAPGRSVILTGGARTPSDALVGPVALAGLRIINVDVAFLGAHGMHEAAGFTSPNLAEGEANRALISRSRQTVLLADHTKWNVVGLCTFAELGEVDALITDSGLPPAALGVLRSRIPAVISAVSPN